MYFESIRRWTKTLGFRLMAWNAIIVILTAVVTLLGMQIGVRRALMHELDQFLIDDLDDVCQSVLAKADDFALEPISRKPTSNVHLSHGRFVAVFEADGKVWAASDNQPESVKLPSEFADLPPTTIGNYRFTQRIIYRTVSERLLVRVGIPLDIVTSDVKRIDSMASLVAGIVLITAPLVGYWLSQNVTNVLSDLNQRAETLRPTQLDERLPVRGSGDELDRLAITINGLLDRIASFVALRRDFVADAAHELRTPVAAIRASTEVALSTEREPREYEVILGDVIVECEYLDTLVTQLLTLTENDRDQITWQGESVPLHQIVERSMEMLRPVAESLGLALDSDICPVNVHGSPSRLRQVINNLLDNAMKYTEAPGRVQVTLREVPAANVAELSIADTGIGIPPDDLPLVFERFHRVDRSRSHNEGQRGTGLGLSICQTIVEAHGGHISVTSEPGKGSTFTVQLPLMPK